MNYCLFLLGHLRDSTEDTAAAATAEIGALLPALRGVPGLSALAHHRRAAVGVQDPRIAEAAGPDRAIQLFFRELLCLESALSEDGLLQRCIGTRSRQPLAWRLQAMAARHYPVADPGPARDPAGFSGAGYFVSYEGRADDDAAWLTHYLRHHPPIMGRLPGLRRLEIHSRLDCRDETGIPRAAALQRNLVAFDDAQALAAALASPVRAELRADYQAFPPFRGASPHCTMASQWQAAFPASAG